MTLASCVDARPQYIELVRNWTSTAVPSACVRAVGMPPALQYLARKMECLTCVYIPS